MAAARSIGHGTIHLGLVAIPVKLYTAQSEKSVSFRQLHRCKSPLKQVMVCPAHVGEVIERDKLVKGYEFARDQFVTFTEDELQALEATQAGAIQIAEFVPRTTIGPLNVEKTYFLGPDKGGDRAYRMVAELLASEAVVAVGTHAKRGRDALVAVQAVGAHGLMLHECLYADEVRSFDDVELGAKLAVGELEFQLARRLVQKMRREAFDASRFRNAWADRVLEAVDRKVQGEEFVMPPTLPGAQVMDLVDALRGSLDAEPAPPVSTPKGPAKAKPRGKAPRARRAAQG